MASLNHTAVTSSDTTTPGTAAEQQVPAHARLSALRQALAHAGTATTALVDLSATLKDAGAPGLAWDADHLADPVEAIADVIAQLVKTGEERTDPINQGEGDRAGRTV